jgi:predicted RNA-binding Zn-ribbon protein involved in translation (DUF1610 family)
MKEKTILVFTCPICGNHELRIEDIIQTNIEEMWHLGDPGMIDYYEGQTQDPLNSQYVCADCDWHSHLNLERLLIAGTLTEKEITE